MKVSVVVVSYNMCALLRKSLTALTSAVNNVDAEIILIDNCSTDRTLETVNKEFPEVRTATAFDCSGTSRSVNQGISMAKGEYVLVLSPDALTNSDAIAKAVEFMDTHTTAGGLSVRILDTEGNYLPESKKILPRSWINFFKVTGLLRQFVKSRFTEHYFTRHDDEFDTAETDLLNDKFMMLRRSTLNKTGLLDERFALYGANIDLSYRIRLAGFKNYYFPKTYIINLGYSQAPKFSWVKLKNFYGAMFIFAVKYIFKLPAIHVKPLQDLYPAYELKG